MSEPTWTRRFLDYWAGATPPAYTPETAAWTASCPHCSTDSDWWSARTTTGFKYRLACPQCGDTEWTADRRETDDTR